MALSPLTPNRLMAFGDFAPSTRASAVRMCAPLSGWAWWRAEEAGVGGAFPTFLDANLRRRLSPLAKAALQVAHDCAGHLPQVRMVYASRHGELARTTRMLQELALDQEISPMAFSMSVLNATAGVYSIARQDHATATAISATEDTLGMGLLEACMQWTCAPKQPVLLLYADEPAPALYGAVAGDLPNPLVLGLLLDTAGADEIVMEMCAPGRGHSAMSQPQAFMECLGAARQAHWESQRHSWTWHRNAR